VRPHLRRLLAGSIATSLIVGTLAVVQSLPASAAGFSPGNLVVARVGTGEAALSNAATPVFLDEYTPAGTLVQSIALPTAVSGANRRLTMSGSATSEGALALSMDGRYLTLAGYDADPGTAAVAGTTTSAVSRVVGRVDGGGGVDTTTAITDIFSGNNVRGAVTDDGSRFWAVGANGGVRLAPLGSSGATTAINSAAPTNLRVAGILGGQLYVSTGSGTAGVYAVGTGLPTGGGQTPTLTAAVPAPYAFVAVDSDAAVSGVDTLYVADESSAPGGGVVKFSFDGTVWTARGSFRPAGAGARGLTGTRTATGVTLFATTTTNALVKVDDTAAYTQPIAATATTLRTGSANTALRGVAFAPAASTVAPAITTQPQDVTITPGQTATLTVAASGTGPLTYQWYAGTAGDTGTPVGTGPSFTTPALVASATYWVRVSGPGGTVDSRTATVTVNTAPNTAPTVTPNPVLDLALTMGDPDNPPALRTIEVGDAENAVDSLTVTVTSANPSVATGGATGTGATRTLTVTPVGVGRTTLTVTVSDGSLTASTTFPVAVSGALPAGTKNHYGASDASTAIDLGNGTMIVADDETNVLRAYDRTHSRYPAAAFDVRAAGLALRDNDVTREIDIEAAARTGDTIYWVGSHGQNSSGNTRLNRQELFATTVNGGTLSLAGSYQHLRDDLIAWDQATGDALGLAAAATRAPESTPAGFNIEGAEIAPDGSLLLGFRGPLTADGKAIVVPVTNIGALVTANPTTGITAAFGTALRWDLGGRGIREIRRSAANQYLIIAGPPSEGTGGAGEFRFYTWDGNPASTPLLRAGSLDSVAAAGKPEAIVEVAEPLTSVQVLTDSGDNVWYGDGTIAKDLSTVLRKATSAVVPVGVPPACTAAPVSIGSVQGTTDTSPVAGQTRTVRGTVVADYEGAQPALRGFYLQDGGDGNPSTSDGLFVFDNGANLVSNGDLVEVTGQVSEFQGQTQISSSGIEVCGHGTAAPVDVALPQADFEPYEGMLVRFHQTLTVTEHFQLGRFGQVVVSSGGRLRQPTSDIRATDQAAVQAAQQANNRNRLIIDDANQAQNPDPIVFGRAGAPLSAANTLRGGDTVTDPVGVLTFTWAGNAASGNAFRLRPVGSLGGTAVFDPVNERPTAPPSVGAGGIKVASANLLNFFNTFTGCRFGTVGGPADCRGPNNAAEYDRQLAKEIASLRFLDADVIGYMEMENDGYGSASAVRALVDALNAVDGPGAWAFVDADAATGVVDVAGTDAIKAGLLYRTASVRAVPGATFVDQNPMFERRPVAQTFQTPAGARFTVIANHFKSKGSCPDSGPDADQGDGQSCWNPRRTAQANELASWISGTVIPGSGDSDVLVVGDLNSYAGEDPIAALESAGYVNLIKSFHGLDAYSYVFDGQWGYLDYVLASESMVAQITGAGDAHHNADEPAVLDYNTEFKTPAQVASLYAPDRFRTSDHDPVLVGVNLGAGATITGTPAAATVGAPYSFNFTVGGTGAATVTVTAGSLPPGLTLSASGVVTGTPAAAGDFAFTVRASNAFGAASHATSVHVDKGASTTTLAAAPNPVATGSPVRFTATVAAGVASTGTVTFTEGATVLGTGELAGGQAMLTVSTLATGRHTVVATYAGNADLLGSASAPSDVDVLDPVTIGTPLPGGTVGVAYSATVPHTGSEPVTFAITSGALPPGLVLSASGVITGTPTAAGAFPVTITATNAVSTAARAFVITVAKAATVTVVTSSANPAIYGAPVRFTATVSGGVVGGTVQFTVDGRSFGSPVPVVGGTAVSDWVSTLGLGSHAVTAAFSGNDSYLASSGSMSQVVWLAVTAITPKTGSKIPAGSVVPITFQLTDASGRPISHLAALLLLASGRVNVSASGAQSLPSTGALYDPFTSRFFVPWPTVRRAKGQVTITITVTYPGAPTQQVPVVITLT
jgi:predicted extracellular nuclease